MAYYRIQLSNGTSRTVQAVRMRTDARSLYLEERAAGNWREVLAEPLAEVQRVQRRFTENNGTWTWLNERLPAPVGGIRAW
ncbi:hypothetical protein [Nocardiopsis algeriensis]|uniref:Uncharacterized protein n=1 Tax=Nocardiopsis algeriensis TaxID=1478215 RepID=A0A841IT50_9ACTN|nr:hypothetical protein [Nocardiopsis algeriensis]MBB6121857.1 hypothetical protein [Nocardiopsis algeriensis]